MLQKLLRHFLQLDKTDQQVQKIQKPVIQSSEQTVTKIEALNTILLQKTRTYYIAKAMGIL